jgi:hypothetical protein
MYTPLTQRHDLSLSWLGTHRHDLSLSWLGTRISIKQLSSLCLTLSIHIFKICFFLFQPKDTKHSDRSLLNYKHL